MLLPQAFTVSKRSLTKTAGEREEGTSNRPKIALKPPPEKVKSTLSL